jgi:REP element-mobilizing transposase RayT
MLGEDPGLAACVRGQMKSEPYLLAQASRTVVLDAIREVCTHRGWTLFAAHVRTNHVHAVVEADVRPEEILNDWKAYASRRLNFVEAAKRPRWARHGSTRWLWKDQDVRDAIKYVAEGQGEPMVLFVANLY